VTGHREDRPYSKTGSDLDQMTTKGTYSYNIIICDVITVLISTNTVEGATSCVESIMVLETKIYLRSDEQVIPQARTYRRGPGMWPPVQIMQSVCYSLMEKFIFKNDGKILQYQI